MKIVSMPRGYGKTEQMVMWLRESNNGVLVVHSKKEKVRILDQYFHDKEDKQNYTNRILTISEIGQLIGRSDRRMAVDNIELCLEAILGPIEIGTISNETM